ELVELAIAGAIHPVDVLVALGADRLVGHADEPGIGLLGPVFGEDGLAPFDGFFAEQGQERLALDVLPRLAAGELDQGRRDVLANEQARIATARFYFWRKSDNKR